MDRLEVLWETGDGSRMWWPCEVIAVATKCVGHVLAVGTLMYEEMRNVEAQLCDVEFVRGQLVRPKRNPKNSRSESESSWRQVTNTTDDDNHEEEWCPHRSLKNKARVKTRSKHCTPVASPAAKRLCRGEETGHQAHATSAVVNDKPNNGNTETIEEAMSGCVKRLGHMEKKLEVYHMKSHEEMSSKSSCIVKRFMLRAILRQLQRPFRRNLIGSGVVDGGHTVGFVSAHVDCTRRTFSSLALEASDAGFETDCWPSIAIIQSNSAATKEAVVRFSTLRNLCAWLGVNEYRDRESMLIKDGGTSSTHETMVRILGTMVSKEGEGNARDVNYLVGRSSQSSTEFNDVTILHRQSEAWDIQNDSFVHPLRVATDFTTQTLPLQIEEDLNSLRSTSFHLSWKKSPDLNQRLWTVDVSQHGNEVFGELHLVLPAIYFYFPGVCAEVSNALSAQYCKNLLE